jgi:hypothetical protein
MKDLKVGDAVKCIDATKTLFLEKDKIYIVSEIKSNDYIALCGKESYYKISRFIKKWNIEVGDEDLKIGDEVIGIFPESAKIYEYRGKIDDQYVLYYKPNNTYSILSEQNFNYKKIKYRYKTMSELFVYLENNGYKYVKGQQVPMYENDNENKIFLDEYVFINAGEEIELCNDEIYNEIFLIMM